MKFSANLGFLWNELRLPDAIRAARSAGFGAVECHWPYDVPPEAVKSALDDTGLKMLCLNTRRGDVAAGDNGLAAILGREGEARAAIAYATAIGTPNIHVMAAFARGDAAHDAFVSNLKYACGVSASHGTTILIEPLNRYDAPGYWLTTIKQASSINADLRAPNLKLMFDCYHVQLIEGDLAHRIKALLSAIGHIQFASVPDRGATITAKSTVITCSRSFRTSVMPTR